MRKIIVFNRMSLDGAYAAADGKMGWFIPDPLIDKAAHDIMDIDTLVMGRTTYQEMEAVWPKAAADPKAPPPMRQIGEEMNAMTKVVFSRTLTGVTWENSELYKGDLVSEVRKLKRRGGKDIAIFGSGSVVKQLAVEGLIDEYLIILTPVVLGSGRSLFSDEKEQSLSLADARVFDSGNTLNHYLVEQRPKKAAAAKRS